MPQISLYYQPSFKDSTVNISRQDWEVSYNLGNSWNKVKRNKKANSSLYKVDITIYPELSLKNLVITQIYQVLFNLSRHRSLFLERDEIHGSNGDSGI